LIKAYFSLWHTEKGTTMKKIKEVSEKSFMKLCNEYAGFCIECHAKAHGVEPDAEKYECAKCKKKAVYGYEQALLLGFVKIK
jgi:hypothetical protein